MLVAQLERGPHQEAEGSRLQHIRARLVGRSGVRLLLTLGAVLFVAAPAQAETEAFAIHYQGSYAWHQNWDGGSVGPTAGSYLRTDETLSWVLDVSGSSSGPGMVTNLHTKLSAQGTVDQQGSDPNANEHCTMVQAAGGNGNAYVGRLGNSALNVGLNLPSTVGRDLVVTGNRQNCGMFSGSVLMCNLSSCAGATVCGAVPPVVGDPEFSAALTPGLDGVKEVTKAFDVGGPRASETVSCANGGKETTQIAITSSVRVNAGGKAVHTPSKRKHIPEIERQKTFARGDLLPTLFRAEAACGTVALGTTGLVWGTTVPGAGGVAAIAGDMMIVGAGPECIALINRVYDDARIANDPPRKDFTKIARPRPVRTRVRMPGCARRPAALASFCTGLRTEVLAHVAAVRKATAIADALQVTVDRESGALRAGKTTALRNQLRAGTHLLAELRAASRAERAAGAKIAKRLRAESVGGTLDAAQTSAAVARITTAVGKRGITRAMLPPAPLAATSVDLVAALTR